MVDTSASLRRMAEITRLGRMTEITARLRKMSKISVGPGRLVKSSTRLRRIAKISFRLGRVNEIGTRLVRLADSLLLDKLLLKSKFIYTL